MRERNRLLTCSAQREHPDYPGCRDDPFGSGAYLYNYSNLFFDPPQVDLATPRNETPPIASPPSTPILASTSLDRTAIPLATSSHSRASVPASATVAISAPALAPAPIVPVDSAPAPAPAPAPAIQADSQNELDAQNDGLSTQPTVTVNSSDTLSRAMEAAAITVTSESSAGPSTSVPGPAGNSDAQNNSQDTQNVPPSSDAPGTTSKKAPAKKTAKTRSPRITAK